MKVNILGYKISPEEYYPHFILTIDGKPNGSIILAPLEVSANEEGVFPIINCSCGEWGCGGDKVEVTHEQDYILWKTERYMFDKYLRFTKDNYNQVVRELLSEKDKNEFENAVYKEDMNSYINTKIFPYD